MGIKNVICKKFSEDNTQNWENRLKGYLPDYFTFVTKQELH